MSGAIANSKLVISYDVITRRLLLIFQGENEMKKGFLSVLGFGVLVVFLLAGCDYNSPYNPFGGGGMSGITSADTGDLMDQPSSTTEVEFSLPKEFQNMIFPGESTPDRVLGLAPAAENPRIWVESNLFDGAGYPGTTKKMGFTSTAEFTGSKTKMYTGAIGWLRAWFENGGTIYQIQLNGTRLTDVDSNGAFLFQLTTNGVVEQKQSGTAKLVPVSIRLTSGESTGKVIYFSSEMTGGASLPMTYNSGSKAWELSLGYPAGKPFWVLPWSDTRGLYGIGNEVLSINGTRAVHLESTGAKIDNIYTKYQFEGSLEENGQFKQKENNLSVSI